MILQYVIVGAISLLLVVIQSALLPFLSETLFVDLLFVTVVVIGLFKAPLHGSFMSAGVGLLQDLMVTTVPGLFMAARVSVFMVAQALRGRLSPDTPGSQFIIALGLGVFDRIVVFLLHQVFTTPLHLSGRTAVLMLIGTLINAALVPLFYYGFEKIPGFVETGPETRFLQ